MGDEIALAEERDPDGFASLGHYAVLGDGRGAALVAVDGSIDWWAVPALDSALAFAALLDPVRGGQITLRPNAAETTATRRYLPHTNLVETTFRTPTGSVE